MLAKIFWETATHQALLKILYRFTSINHYANAVRQKNLIFILPMANSENFVLTIFRGHLISPENKIRHTLKGEAVSKEVI